jgi:hypothetical protein
MNCLNFYYFLYLNKREDRIGVHPILLKLTDIGISFGLGVIIYKSYVVLTHSIVFIEIKCCKIVNQYTIPGLVCILS